MINAEVFRGPYTDKFSPPRHLCQKYRQPLVFTLPRRGFLHPVFLPRLRLLFAIFVRQSFFSYIPHRVLCCIIWQIYKSTKCNDMQQTGYCPRGPFCAFAHVDRKYLVSLEMCIHVGLLLIIRLQDKALWKVQTSYKVTRHHILYGFTATKVNGIWH